VGAVPLQAYWAKSTGLMCESVGAVPQRSELLGELCCMWTRTLLVGFDAPTQNFNCSKSIKSSCDCDMHVVHMLFVCEATWLRQWLLVLLWQPVISNLEAQGALRGRGMPFTLWT
jgi:hypothetical protein